MNPFSSDELRALAMEIAEHTPLSVDDALRGVAGVLEICRNPAEVVTLAREFIRSTTP